MLKAVIFDMDGVIINSEHVYQETELKIAASLGLKLTIDEFSQYAGVYIDEMWQDLENRYNLRIDIPSIIQKEEAMMREYYSKGKLDVITESVELIKHVYSRGILCAIATSSVSESALSIISRLKLKKNIHTLVTRDMVQSGKPSPDIYLKCIEMLNVSKNECVCIEDSKSGCIAAKASGIKVIAYKNPLSGQHDLSIADAIVDNIAEINLEMISNLL